MCFKGTQSRSVADVANEIDDLGGNVNAFTGKEQTCFHAKVLDENLPRLIDLLSDMVINPKLDRTDAANERKVILDEIDMYEDTPEEVASEKLFKCIYSKSDLEHAVLGTKTEVQNTTADALIKYHKKRFLGGNIVIALAGAFNQDIITQITEIFSKVPAGANKAGKAPNFHSGIRIKSKPGEQNHVAVGNPAVSLLDEERFAFQLLANILGGGMSSRLFQKLREDLGLCYSVYSYIASHTDSGFIGSSIALSPDSEAKALQVYRDEIMRLLDSGVTALELDRAKAQCKSTLVMGLEATNNRMQRLASSELVYGKAIPVEETIASFMAVTQSDILKAIRKAYGEDELAIAAVGAIHKEEWYQRRLEII
jgi:predicted Zn-dependent peptidase